MTEAIPKVISPARYTGMFTTVNTIYTGTGPDVVQLLKADPRRVALTIARTQGFGLNEYALPGPWPEALTAISASNLPISLTFHDAPSWVQGEWYGIVSLGTIIAITECLYVEN